MSEQQEWFTDYDREVAVGAWRERLKPKRPKQYKFDTITIHPSSCHNNFSPPLFPMPVNIPPHSYHWLVSGEWHNQ